LKRNKYRTTQTPQLSNTLGLKEDLKGTAHMAHIRYKITFCLLVNLKEGCYHSLNKRNPSELLTVNVTQNQTRNTFHKLLNNNHRHCKVPTKECI